MRDPIPLTLLVTGKLYLQAPPLGKAPGMYVIQRTRRGWGQYDYTDSRDLQLRRYVIPFDPMTAPQLARRALFAQAVNAWHEAFTEQRERSRSYATMRGISLFNAFISMYMSSFSV